MRWKRVWCSCSGALWNMEIANQGVVQTHTLRATVMCMAMDSQARWRQRFNGLFPMGGCGVASIMDWQILRISSTQT